MDVVEGLSKQSEWIPVRSFTNGGSIVAHRIVNRLSHDYKDIYESCEYFAAQSQNTAICPKVRKANYDKLYANIYPELVGTRYDRKCPDLKVGAFYYEVEGYITKNPNGNTIGNMIKRGSKQSSRVIIMHVPGTTDRYYRKRMFDLTGQINSNVVIDELWIKEGNVLRQVF